ncbi:hypothetical protein Hypma_016166 [Hypsizygus marmoreus]|uniref:Uncharacterized protein n=1 Tax=Hypsizygus marmoreus TaxID=39966 RepID=A0A369J3K1_HYPMA|nr:hypothetical protein Hypma_016166 [Hypsizygus marmoreus]
MQTSSLMWHRVIILTQEIRISPPSGRQFSSLLRRTRIGCRDCAFQRLLLLIFRIVELNRDEWDEWKSSELHLPWPVFKDATSLR